MLLPICCLTTKKWMTSFGKNKAFIQMLSSCDFLHNNTSVSVADCVWLYGNFKFITNTYEYVIVGDANAEGFEVNQLDSSEFGSDNGITQLQELEEEVGVELEDIHSNKME